MPSDSAGEGDFEVRLPETHDDLMEMMLGEKLTNG